MNKKCFVSLYFTSRKIQVLLLNRKKDSVIQSTSVDLPQGLVTNNRVSDQAKLSQIIASIWKSLGIKERYVGIVVPEFSTFIKFFKLPRVEIAKLDEAVHWQVQDILPGNIKDIVFDWKILNATEDGFNVLVVAISQDVLAGYVNAVGLAGLYPLVVETPALALSRLSDSQSLGKLIVYLNDQEALIVIARGDKIYGSSITPINEASIIQITEGIVNHFNDIKIERVVIGGVGFNENLISNLEHKFAIKPIWMTPTVSGFNSSQIQEFLVPISLQSKDPKEPRDEYSINLLPPEWVQNYEAKRLRKQISELLRNSVLVILTVFLLTLGFYISLNSRLVKLKKESLKPVDKDIQVVLDKAQKINNQSEKVLSITKQIVLPQDIINSIVQSVTSGIQLTSYKINFDSGEINITGKAANRLNLIDFKTSLEKTGKFGEVALPLKSMEKETDLDFSLKLQYLAIQKSENEGTIEIK